MGIRRAPSGIGVVVIAVLLGAGSRCYGQAIPTMEVVREALAAREAAVASLHVQLARMSYVATHAADGTDPELLPLEVLTADYDWRDGVARYSEAVVGTGGGVRSGRATYSMSVETPEESVCSCFSAVPNRPSTSAPASVWERMTCKTIRGEPTGRHNWVRWEVGLATKSVPSMASCFSAAAHVVGLATIRGEECVQVADGATTWLLSPRLGFAPMRQGQREGEPGKPDYTHGVKDWLDYRQVGDVWLAHRRLVLWTKTSQVVATGEVGVYRQSTITSVKLAEVNQPRAEEILGVPSFAGAAVFDHGSVSSHGYSIEDLMYNALLRQLPWGFTTAELTALD